MLVYKFGGTSLGNAERMKSVARLVTRDQQQKIVVLSAVSGTTDTLIKLSRSGEQEGLDILHKMQEQYARYVNELLSTSESKNSANHFLEIKFAELKDLLAKPIPRDERVFVSYGEIISTSLFMIYVTEQGISAALLPALDFMRIEEGEPVMNTIQTLLKGVLEKAGQKDIYITQGYICRNEHDEIDNLRRGGSDYSATIIGAALKVSEIQIWTDI